MTNSKVVLDKKPIICLVVCSHKPGKHVSEVLFPPVTSQRADTEKWVVNWPWTQDWKANLSSNNQQPKCCPDCCSACCNIVKWGTTLLLTLWSLSLVGINRWRWLGEWKFVCLPSMSQLWPQKLWKTTGSDRQVQFKVSCWDVMSERNSNERHSAFKQRGSFYIYLLFFTNKFEYDQWRTWSHGVMTDFWSSVSKKRQKRWWRTAASLKNTVCKCQHGKTTVLHTCVRRRFIVTRSFLETTESQTNYDL